MTAELYTCPRCATPGFLLQGLQRHVCHGATSADERRSLTLAEITQAYAAGTPIARGPLVAERLSRRFYRTRNIRRR